ncbi:MAG: hypothetical protein AAFR84_02350 [Pseudomonadota bacterium]
MSPTWLYRIYFSAGWALVESNAPLDRLCQSARRGDPILVDAVLESGSRRQIVIDPGAAILIEPVIDGEASALRGLPASVAAPAELKG